MRRNWTVNLGVALASAAVLAGCRGQQERTAIDQSTDQVRQDQQVSVTGCVSTGIGNDRYMLTAVQLSPLAEQPSDAASRTSQRPITPDAQVRLAMDDEEQLERLVGQKVTVIGALTDDGRNTIGTSGSNDAQTPANGMVEPRTDRSQAASDQHYSKKVAEEAGPIGQRSMNNGTFPEITVARINSTGEKCPTWPVEERR